jgi:tRNA threonylcarbamoyladenosine biosynthesis protein TsaE
MENGKHFDQRVIRIEREIKNDWSVCQFVEGGEGDTALQLTPMPTIITNKEIETRALGRRIGERVAAGTVVGINGTLGTGKTRLAQGIGCGLGIDADSIVSPTYTLCVPYYTGRLPLIHLDAYRIQDVSEVDELGLDELVDEGAVLVVEWSDRIVNYLPPLDLLISIDHVGNDQRLFQLESLSGLTSWLDEI